MKILEAQSATLTNYEVYLHLTEMQSAWERKRENAKTDARLQEQEAAKLPKRFADQMEITVVPRRPGNLETISSQVNAICYTGPRSQANGLMLDSYCSTSEKLPRPSVPNHFHTSQKLSRDS